MVKGTRASVQNPSSVQMVVDLEHQAQKVQIQGEGNNLSHVYPWVRNILGL